MPCQPAIVRSVWNAVAPATRPGVVLTVMAAIGLGSCAQSLISEQQPLPSRAAVADENQNQHPPSSKTHSAAMAKPVVEPSSAAAKKETGVRTAAIATGTLSSPKAFRDCPDCPDMIELPAGSFTMGSDEFDEDRGISIAKIAKPFAAGKFEVTFAEWQACVVGGGCAGNTAPSDEGWGRERRPIVNVSWDDAKQYAAWLSRKTGRTYRLLTDAEWEYAARAGSRARWSFGSEERRLRDFAWFDVNAGGKTHPVGGKKSNAFGFHDMHGNVWEWVDACRDEFRTAAATEGAAPTTERHTECKIRGGSWNSRAGHVRSAQYDDAEPANRSNDIGFRVARDIE